MRHDIIILYITLNDGRPIRMKPYRLHIFVCQGKRCAARGGEQTLETLKERIKSEGIKDVKVSKSGCLKVCKETDAEGELCPAAVVYPEGVWYQKVTADAVDAIINDHVKKGALVEKHFLYKMNK